MSGSALSSWAVTEHPRYYTKKLAELVNCSRYIDDSPKLLACFKVKPASLLVNMSAQIRAPKYLSSFGPVVQTSVLPDSVTGLMHRAMGSGRTCELFTGVMKNEGLSYLSERQLQKGIAPIDEKKLLRTYVNNIYSYHRQRIFDVIRHHYTAWDRESNNETIRDGVIEMLGDSQYVAPALDLARRHAQIADTYFYTFTYPSRLESYPRWAGGAHGEDLFYVFGAPLADGIKPFPSSYTRTERMLSEGVMRYWSNFIKTG